MDLKKKNSIFIMNCINNSRNILNSRELFIEVRQYFIIFIDKNPLENTARMKRARCLSVV